MPQRAAVNARRRPHRNPFARRRTIALTLAATLAGCAGLDPLSRAASDRLVAFDFYWQQLATDYPLFGQQPVAWNELRQRYRAAVPFAQQPHEFYHLLTGMLSELGDVHVSFAVPADRFAAGDTAPTSLLDVDGFDVMPIEGRLHVTSWPLQQAPAVPEGLPLGAGYPELWRVEGFPVVLSLIDNLLLGPPGTAVELQLRWRNGALTRHVLQRPAAGTERRTSPLGHLVRNGDDWQLRRTQPFSWLEVHRLEDDLPMARIDQAIDRAAASDGLVLDLRANLGGRWSVAQSLVERFLREPVELVLAPPHPRSTWFGLFAVEVFVQSSWQPRPPRFERPLVVLTSALTGSAAEHAARVLQRYSGATVIGERTAGAEAVIQAAEGPDGGTLRFGSTRVLDRTGVGLQDEGVVPDVSVRLTLDDVERLGPDEAARDWEQRLFDAARARLQRRRGPQ
jgi:C-terminal processing protease CtpA/Prc